MEERSATDTAHISQGFLFNKLSKKCYHLVKYALISMNLERINALPLVEETGKNNAFA